MKNTILLLVCCVLSMLYTPPAYAQDNDNAVDTAQVAEAAAGAVGTTAVAEAAAEATATTADAAAEVSTAGAVDMFCGTCDHQWTFADVGRQSSQAAMIVVAFVLLALAAHHLLRRQRSASLSGMITT